MPPSETVELDRLCLYCEHFHMELGSPHYSDVTPGTDFSMECGEKCWTFDPHQENQSSFNRCILTARTCDRFVFNPTCLRYNLKADSFYPCKLRES